MLTLRQTQLHREPSDGGVTLGSRSASRAWS